MSNESSPSTSVLNRNVGIVQKVSVAGMVLPVLVGAVLLGQPNLGLIFHRPEFIALAISAVFFAIVYGVTVTVDIQAMSQPLGASSKDEWERARNLRTARNTGNA